MSLRTAQSQEIDELRAKRSDILEAIRKEKQLTDDIDGKLKAFLDDFSKKFA